MLHQIQPTWLKLDQCFHSGERSKLDSLFFRSLRMGFLLIYAEGLGSLVETQLQSRQGVLGCCENPTGTVCTSHSSIHTPTLLTRTRRWKTRGPKLGRATGEGRQGFTGTRGRSPKLAGVARGMKGHG